jgi:hypothetical protein
MQATEAPIACTLDLGAMGSRLSWIRRVTAEGLLSHALDRRTLRLTYRHDAADEVRRIVEFERDCCAFLDFALAVGDDDVVLTITAPESAGDDAAHRLFSQFLPSATPVAASPGCGCRGGAACN